MPASRNTRCASMLRFMLLAQTTDTRMRHGSSAIFAGPGQAQSPRARQRRMHVIRREAHTQCLSSCHSLWEACRGRTRHASMGSLAFSQGPACVCDVGAQSQATAEVTHTECSNAWVTVSHNGALHTLLLFSCAQLQTATPPTTRAHNTHNTRRRCWLCTSSWALCL